MHPEQWRLLFLLHCPPRADAAHGGGRIAAQFLSALSERHRVALAYLRDLGQPPIDEDLRRKCEVVREIWRVDAPRPLYGRVAHRLRILTSPLKGLPRWAAHLPGPTFSACVREVVRDWKPDLIQLEFSVMGRYLPALAGYPGPTVLNLHMPGADSVEPPGPDRHWLHRMGRRLDLLAWRRFERRVFRSVSAVVTYTPRDRDEVTRSGMTRRVEHIPAGFTSPAAPLRPTGSGPRMLLFVGHYAHPPNREAAERLVSRIFPRVRDAFPDVCLCLVGGGLPAAIARGPDSRVIAPGEVPDVTPYLREATLVLAPVRMGGGVRVKVLEALAAGKAIVATPRAVEGIPVRHGREIVLAETDEEFASAIRGLLVDGERRTAMADRAYAWASSHLAWECSVTRYEQLYAELVMTPSRRMDWVGSAHPGALGSA